MAKEQLETVLHYNWVIVIIISSVLITFLLKTYLAPVLGFFLASIFKASFFALLASFICVEQVFCETFSVNQKQKFHEKTTSLEIYVDL